MAADIQIIYTDIQTGRIARIADYSPVTMPADLEEFTWQTMQLSLIPSEVFNDPLSWEVSIVGKITPASGEVSDENRTRILLAGDKANCLEQISRIINVMRFRKATNMFANPQVIPMYQHEIDIYKRSQVAGPLLMSLVDNVDDVPVAIAEFEIANTTYDSFLLSSEMMRNKWIRQIKQSSDPFATFNSIKKTIGI